MTPHEYSHENRHRQNGLNLRRLLDMTVWPIGIHGHRLESITLRRKDDKCLIVLRKKSPRGNMVAFVDGRSWEWALWAAARHVADGTLRWKPDIYRQ